MSSNFGTNIKISIFGQSHSEGIGVVIDGLPPGKAIDLERVKGFMARRAPGNNAYSTPRKERDQVRILSGLYKERTCGAPLCGVIENTNTRSKDYEILHEIPRPGHADYTAWVKYKDAHDYRGGGHFSGRLTAPLCFAGAVAMQFLEEYGITVGAHILSIAGIRDERFDGVSISREILERIQAKEFPVMDEERGSAMRDAIAEAKLAEDSVGGIVECAVVGLPAGVGEPMFDGLENRLAAALFAIPAVKGVEFGAGFQAAEMRGSEHNDAFLMAESGAEPKDENGNPNPRFLKTATNRHGGILGGISSGMPVILRVAFKPTPSIGSLQQSVSLLKKKEQTLRVEGRHDPCIVPRAVPCVEAAVAVQLLDLMSMGGFLK